MFDTSRIAEPDFIAENRIRAHSDHRWFRDAAEAVAGASSYEQCLNGLWKFHYAKNPGQTIAGFEAADLDCGSWDDIPVPAHIQLQGYDRPQYTNVQYPWDGQETVEPGGVPLLYNPVASYVKTFTLDEPLQSGERLGVSFKGAESAIAVWLNGVYVGYGSDSFTPSEFDLTDALVEGENKLAAQVFRWSAGSWIEDQDFYRFSGLFRDVVLYRRPATHIEDIHVTTSLSADLGEAVVAVDISLEGLGTVRATVLGAGELRDLVGGQLTIRIANPHLWSPEDPFLYDLLIDVRDERGNLTEHIPYKVGVRRVGIEDGVLRINGERIVFHGVNRHEFGLKGRVVTSEETEADIRLMKAAGINAVRTSHYPNNTFFYELCDQYGLYVIDEMNLEAHGMWDKIVRGGLPIDEALPGDRPEWLPTLLDRASSMYERDKNHACIVMWSCGNESFGGTNILAVSNYLHGVDSRPVHYEGAQWDPRHPEISDVASQMYTPAAEIEQWLLTHRDKPLILCEYAHAMGNSFGAVDKYVDLAYREPLFQGGFIWDFADQAIQLVDRYGSEYFGYGGDCGESPSDYDFSADGILFADHTPSPKMQEVKYLYQGIRTLISRDLVEIQNRYLFTNSSAFECVVTLGREGKTVCQHRIDTSVAAGASGTYPLPVSIPDAPGEYTVDVSFRLRHATSWAPVGHEVAWEQAIFTVVGERPTKRPLKAPDLVEGIHNLGVRGSHFIASFSRIHGGLTSYRYGLTSDGGKELLRSIPQPNFWHAPTSNERGWGMPGRDGQWLLASRYAQVTQGMDNPCAVTHHDSIEVRYHYVLPTTPHSACDLAYRVFGTGRIEVTMTVRPGEGLPDMPEFGLLLTSDADLHHLQWYGEGPDECYVDRRSGARLGVYASDVRRELTPYVRPQEAGNRTGVRWATVTDDRGVGIHFDCAQGMEFSALPWTPFEVENATHPGELPPSHHTVLRPALMRRGVGGDNSWGAETHPEYRLAQGRELEFRFGFQGVR